MADFKSKGFRSELISWDRVTKWSRQLALKIRAEGFKPDVIVAIARGGFVPARILCDYLGVKKLTGIQVVHYGAGAEEKRAARLFSPLSIDIQGLRVLLVDDLVDTGKTLDIALDHLKNGSPKEIKVATLLYKKVSDMEPDFYVKKVINWRWITFPWAAMEDIGGFIRKMARKPRDIEEAAAILKKEKSLTVPKRVLEDVFTLMD